MMLGPTILLASIDEASDQINRERLGDWLSPGEAERAWSIDSLVARGEWLAGRWLAKRAMIEAMGDASIPRRSLHIESRDARDRGTVPTVYRDGRVVPMQLSISHAGKTVAVAVSMATSTRLGIDVMSRLPMPECVAQFWLCDRELVAVGGDRWACQFVWSLKEALYKAGVPGEHAGFSPRLIDTTAWVSTEALIAATAAIRAGKSYTTAIGGGELQVRRSGREFATLVTLKNRRRVHHERTSHAARTATVDPMMGVPQSNSITNGREVVGR